MKYIVQIFSFSNLKSFTAKFFLTIALSCSTLQLLAQVNENFDDGEFSSNPSWSGTDSKFVIAANALKLQAPALAESAYLATPSTALNNSTWEFSIRMDFNPSSTNYARIYLTSDAPDLSGSLNGYFVMAGGTTDEISLYQQTGTTRTKIIDGLDGRVNLSLVNVRIKVTRDALGNWELLSDIGVNGAFISEGTVNDLAHAASSYFGVLCTYTATRSDKFYFDDFVTTEIPVVDIVPPTLVSIQVVSNNQIDIAFSENVLSSSFNLNSFTADHNLNHPVQATLNDSKTIRLTFSQPFPNGAPCSLTITSVADESNNIIAPVTQPFLFFESVPANTRDLVISELMADPSPPNTLPEVEYVEIFNNSSNPFKLDNWTLTDGTSTAKLSSIILLPQEYVIITSTTNASKFTGYGQVMGVSNFPSLNNSGDAIVLKNENNLVIDSVNYSSTWYNDDDKKDGGWSLEMIDPLNSCNDSDNWNASADPRGGTPGKENSIYKFGLDKISPKLISALAVAPDSLRISFDEKLLEPETFDFIFNPSLNIKSVAFSSTRQEVNVILSGSLTKAIPYSLQVKNIKDCSGNTIDLHFDTASFMLLPDLPVIKTIEVISDHELTLTFSKEIDKSSAEEIKNFWVNYDIGYPSIAILEEDKKQISLTFEKNFPNGILCAIEVKNVKDVEGFSVTDAQHNFLYFNKVAAIFKDVIINEIFADPTPSQGLPEVEYVELYNRSEKPFQLQGWQFTDGTTIALLNDYILLPKKYIVLCFTSSEVFFDSLIEVMGTKKFPSLNNAGDNIMLMDENNIAIDSVHYSDEWYHDSEKKEGGYALEIIDPDNYCNETANWMGSENNLGGTPGVINSVFASRPDLTGPKILSGFALSTDTLLVTFNEKLESIKPSVSNFIISPTVMIQDVFISNESMTEMKLICSAFLPGVPYTLVVDNIHDCSANELQKSFSKFEFGLAEPVEEGDVMINEVLFNPRPTGVDFVEIVNVSSKYLNIKDWTLANVKDGNIANSKVIATENILLKPNAYMVFTNDANILLGEYINAKGDTFVEANLPSLNDDEGSIIIQGPLSKSLDFFEYSDNMHSVFLQNTEGVSLERISLSQPANESSNWKSASATVGFATPGYANSNAVNFPVSEESVSVAPEVFVPVNGQPDFTEISYSFDQGGYVANVKVIDSQGHVLKQLANNEVLGSSGFLRWDGDRDDGTKARVGYYQISFEIFDSSGAVKTFRKSVAIGSTF